MTNPTTLPALLALSKKVIKDVQMGLCVGRGNIKSTLEKTNNWSGELVWHVRNASTWEKRANGNHWQSNWGALYFDIWEKQFAKTKPTAEEKRTARIGQFARSGARAYYNRAGNCDEMTWVALYHLAQFFTKNTQYKTAIDKGDLVLSKIDFPKEMGHTLVELKINEKDDKGQMTTRSIYVDPWLGASYTSDEFLSYKKDIVDLFLKDYTFQEDFDNMRKAVHAEAIQEISKTKKIYRTSEELEKDIINRIEDKVKALLMDKITPQALTADRLLKFKTSADLKLYQEAFAQEFLTQIQTTSALRQEKLNNQFLIAIEQNRGDAIATFLELGAEVNEQAILASAQSNNPKIIEKIEAAIFKMGNPKLLAFYYYTRYHLPLCASFKENNKETILNTPLSAICVNLNTEPFLQAIVDSILDNKLELAQTLLMRAAKETQNPSDAIKTSAQEILTTLKEIWDKVQTQNPDNVGLKAMVEYQEEIMKRLKLSPEMLFSYEQVIQGSPPTSPKYPPSKPLSFH